MLNLKTFRKAATAASAALLLLAGSAALAHTTVRDQANEGVSTDNAFKIAHGCQQLNLGVTAQSVVFPANSPVITTSDGSVITDLSAVITQGGIAGLLKPIQDKNIFKSQLVKTDALGNVIGFSATVGMLTPPLPGRVPWQFTAPNFEPTGCAKRLLVQIAIADVCVRGVNGPADSLQASKVNLWIPNNGSNFATVGGQQNIDGIGAPATLTINRNVATNPLPSGCGAGIDVTLTPNPADVDANLPIPSYWP